MRQERWMLALVVTLVLFSLAPDRARADAGDYAARTWQDDDVYLVGLAQIDITPDYGVMLRGPEWSGADSSWKGFYTSESSSDPYLAITYAGVTGSGEGPTIKGALGSQAELPMVIELLDGDLLSANLCQDQIGAGQKCLTLPFLLK